LRIVVVLTTNLARKLQEDSAHSEVSNEHFQCLDRIGLQLEPIHPRSNDPNLMKYFAVDLPPDAAITELLEALRNCRAVEAAYFKPSDELP
jgi:hypothetical protein